MAWSKLNDALGKTTYFTSPMRQFQQLDMLSPEQLEAFLENSTLGDWEKNELRSLESKLDYYQERIFYHELSGANKTKMLGVLN